MTLRISAVLLWREYRQPARKTARSSRNDIAAIIVEVDFSVLYQALMNICFVSGEEDGLYYKYKSNGFEDYYVHELHNSLGLYADRVLREVIAPDFAGNIYYTSSSRVKVERLYNLDNREEFSNVVVDYVNA